MGNIRMKYERRLVRRLLWKHIKKFSDLIEADVVEFVKGKFD